MKSSGDDIREIVREAAIDLLLIYVRREKVLRKQIVELGIRCDLMKDQRDRARKEVKSLEARLVA